MTVDQALAETTRTLEEARVENSSFEARVLLEEVLGVSCGQLPQRGGERIDRWRLGRLRKLLALRISGMPLQYVVGSWDFYGARFWLTRGVLIPRPETELVVDAVLKRTPKDLTGFAVDLGTGTGVIAITLKRERPNLSVIAVDSDPVAIRLARKNARFHRLSIQITKGDFCRELPSLPPLSLVVSNPPYIATREWECLDPSVRDFESRLALEGGPDGLSGIRAVLDVASKRLVPEGLVVVEIGASQGEDSLNLAREAGFVSCEICEDLAGRDRVLVASGFVVSGSVVSGSKEGSCSA